jgi:hypothetical protein
MDGQTWYEIVWQICNSPVGLVVIGGVFAWALNAMYAKRPTWQAWEGTIVTAVKWAEKSIPDGSPNAGLARADQALQFVLKAYEAAKARPASQSEIVSLTQGIALVHSVLEDTGALRSAPAADIAPELEEGK